MVLLRRHTTKQIIHLPDDKLEWICEQVACPSGKPSSDKERNRVSMYARKVRQGHEVVAGGFDIWMERSH